MLLFFTVLLIEILYGAEVALFVPSFPELQHTFHLSPFLVEFMISANLVAYCFCGLFTGILGDRYNRRRVILISLWIFLLGSFFCVTAPTYTFLLLGRILQGIGMAGPAVLSYPVISDYYPIEKQAAMMGLLNGVTTLAMAFAPVLGSYINFYFGWHGNFLTLLILSVMCLTMSHLFIPNHLGDKTVSLSPKTYLPLLCSPIFMTFMGAICLLITPYWVFIGMAPILYMHTLGISLKAFGYYQGSLAGVFSIVCLLSPMILLHAGKKNCLLAGMVFCLLSALSMSILLILHNHQPLLITAAVLFMAAGAVFPVNILFPLALTVLDNSKGRASAVLLAGRLLLTAVTLSIVSYFYDNSFFTTGLSMIIALVLSMLFIVQILSKKWAQL
jgi:DHA1 family bicyclomycin/chloramphenicol resistance-like MFS transporter